MACGGLAQCECDSSSLKKQGNSTIRLLKVAFEMRKFIQPLTYGREAKKILLKIGIHYGPVIAGVIGHHKPQFSLIGDTVNTTSRLCSTGRDGKIIISEKAYSQVKDYENLAFFDRKVEAKGKGEMMTYEVKQVRKERKKKVDKSPMEDIRNSLNKYQISFLKHDVSKKQKLFEEILYSESPSDFNLSSPSVPTILRKSMSTQTNILNLIPQNPSKSDHKISKISGLLDLPENPSPQSKINARKLKLFLNNDHKKIVNHPITCFIQRPTFMISPISKKNNNNPNTPEQSPNDNLGFSSFFGKGYQENQDPDSDEFKSKNKPKSIIEEEENPSDISPLEEQSNNKSLIDDPALLIEEFEYEESFPGELQAKFKSNTSFDSIYEEEDVCSQMGNKNIREYVEISKKYLINFSNISLKFVGENEEELIQEFKEILYSDSLDSIEHTLIMSLAFYVNLFEFLLLLIFSFPLKYFKFEIIVLRLIQLVGFFLLTKYKKFLYKINYLKKITWALFALWIFNKNLAYFEDNFQELALFKELSLTIEMLCFSQISFVSFFEAFIYCSISSFFYLVFMESSTFSISKILFLSFSITLILFYSYKNYRSVLNKFNYSLINKQKKNQQNDLLMHLLPTHLFKKFMLNPASKSELIDEFDDVTMLFADIKGFTEFSSKRNATEVVNMLRDLFTEFDKLCLKNNVYKLYTIGDCYVVLGMIDGEKRDSIEEEARNIILMAFSMIETIKLVRKKINYNGLDMRIGIHTGRIIGGIIGTDIVRYDIYGKDVLIANKMESNGKEGHIMVSTATKNLLEQSFLNYFLFEFYKDVNIPSLKTNIGGYFVYPNASIF